MATKIAVALEDDLDGGPADETLRFGVGGAEYEIDLSRTNAKALRTGLARRSWSTPGERGVGRSAIKPTVVGS